MSPHPDGALDTGEALRLLSLAQKGAGALDMLMLIDNRGTVTEGESPRTFSDGKQRMEILGYGVNVGLRVATGTATPSLLLSHLHVIRRSDSATSSIASLLRNQAVDLKIRLSTFRAGGDASPNAQPKFELEFEGGRVADIALLTGGEVGEPCEVIRFAYRIMKIHAAPQLKTGIRGAVRTCELVMP